MCECQHDTYNLIIDYEDSTSSDCHHNHSEACLSNIYSPNLSKICVNSPDILEESDFDNQFYTARVPKIPVRNYSIPQGRICDVEGNMGDKYYTPTLTETNQCCRHDVIGLTQRNRVTPILMPSKPRAHCNNLKFCTKPVTCFTRRKRNRIITQHLSHGYDNTEVIVKPIIPRANYNDLSCKIVPKMKIAIQNY